MPGKKIAKITRKVGRLVFSRFMIILLLFLLQIAVFVSILAWFSERLPWLTAVEQVFTVIMVLYLFNCRMDSSAKLTWMFLIALFPIPSALLLVYTRTEVGKREISRTYAQRIEETRGFISGNAEQVPQSISNLERLILIYFSGIFHYLGRSCMGSGQGCAQAQGRGRRGCARPV